VGRFFWKILISLWLAMATLGIGVDLAFDAYHDSRISAASELALETHAEFAVALVESTLRFGGAAAVKELVEHWSGKHPIPVLIVSADGKDLLDRPVPPSAYARAMSEMASGGLPLVAIRRVADSQGKNYLLFVPAEMLDAAATHMHAFPYPETIVTELIATSLISLLFSLGLAFYIARPIRLLRAANLQLASGKLDTRVSALIGARRDDIADLGHDFDYMAGKLQGMVEAQKRLLHEVSHELRSPLARINVALGLAQQRPEKIHSAGSRIAHEVTRLDEILGATLTLSRLEAGTESLHRAPLDLPALLAAVVDDGRFEAESWGKFITLSSDAAMTIEGNAELLRRALDNVIRNAVRHTPEGTSVCVTLSRERDGNNASLVVCDHGDGVPEADIDRLFEPFFRSASNTDSNGFGLGLAIARRAVEAHGGTIRAHNLAAAGLCVTLSLPLGAARSPQTPAEVASGLSCA